MLFVLISHFAATYFDDSRAGVAWLLDEVGHVATPTFMLISGILVGFLFRTRPHDFTRFRVRLIDRGLFLLTISRALMTLVSWPAMRTARYVMITDVVGVSMIAGPWLIVRLSPARRLVVSATLYSATWVTILVWHPRAPLGWFLQETLFGSLEPRFYLYAFPVIPWFSFELAASVIGDHLGRLYELRDHVGMARVLRTLTGASLSLSALAKGLYLGVFGSHRPGPQSPELQRIVHMLTSRLKFPPAPIYLLFYGGLGLGLLSLWLAADRHARLPRVRAFVAMLGQNSLVMFVTQAAVYYSLIYSAHERLPWLWAWPLYLTLSMVLVVATAAVWHRRGYRRFLTVGYSAWRERRAARGDARRVGFTFRPA